MPTLARGIHEPSKFCFAFSLLLRPIDEIGVLVAPGEYRRVEPIALVSPVLIDQPRGPEAQTRLRVNGGIPVVIKDAGKSGALGPGVAQQEPRRCTAGSELSMYLERIARRCGPRRRLPGRRARDSEAYHHRQPHRLYCETPRNALF
jgi:hypothetical protein